MRPAERRPAPEVDDAPPGRRRGLITLLDPDTIILIASAEAGPTTLQVVLLACFPSSSAAGVLQRQRDRLFGLAGERSNSDGSGASSPRRDPAPLRPRLLLILLLLGRRA